MKIKPILLVMLPALSGCSIHDVDQLFVRKNVATLVRQNDGLNTPNRPAGVNPVSELHGVRIDPKKVPVTESQSPAVDAENLTLESVMSLPPAANVEQARATLIKYLAVTEAHPEAVEKLLVNAEELLKTYSDDRQLQTLFQQLSRYSEWQPVNSIINNAGLSFVTTQGWQPESPFIRARRALLPPVADNEHVIFGDQRLVLLLTNLATVQLHIDARLDDIPFLPESPVQLSYQLDEQSSQHIKLADQDDWKRFTISIPAGEHQVRLYQETPVGNQYVKLRFDDHMTNLSVAQERPYFISTRQSPLELYSQGPGVLRIDEWDNGVISYHYQTIAEGWQKVSLPPAKGKQQSLVRVNQRVVNFKPEPLRNRSVKRSLVPVAPPEAVLKPPVTADKVKLNDAFKLGKQEDGTLSLAVDLVRRNNKQESGKTLPMEQFAQYRVNYRYFDEPRETYWNTGGLFRVREYGGPTFGIDESVYFNPKWLPFNVSSRAKVIAQVPNDQLEALAEWDLTFSQIYNLHPKTRLIPSLTFFARTMSRRPNVLDQFTDLDPSDPSLISKIRSRLGLTGSDPNAPDFIPKVLSKLGVTGLDPNDPNFISKALSKLGLDGLDPSDPNLLSNAVSKIRQRARQLDQDVYTPFKNDHTAGFIPSLTLEHRPWLDTVWSIRIAEGTNENFDITRPDHYSTEAHWKQLLGNVVLDAFYRSAFYQADDYGHQFDDPLPSNAPNRIHASQRSYVGLDVNWQRWAIDQHRIELSGQYSYDIERKAHLAMLSLSVHFGQGRGYRDFAPGEIDFRDIRQRTDIHEQNNSIQDLAN
jgi:hypothetical protein